MVVYHVFGFRVPVDIDKAIVTHYKVSHWHQVNIASRGLNLSYHIHVSSCKLRPGPFIFYGNKIESRSNRKKGIATPIVT